MVVFAPGVSSSQAFNVLAKADARVLWADGSGGVWAVSMTDPGTAWTLYGSGALLISNTGVSLGCLSWSQGLSA